ncbi:DUF4386 domain-containing protein [Candidatus Saccharibacteria bacterium]|nr:DUF4386 domain-containing protein [Candidatus Saccharibacteria bacterium]
MFLKAKNMARHKKISLTVGLLYLLTFVSIPTVALYSNAKDPGFITSNLTATPIFVGGILEVIVAIAGIGTAVMLYGILKKQSEVLSIGLIASRTLEAAGIILGVSFLLTLVTLRDSGIGLEGVAISKALVSLYKNIFLLSQSLMPGINDLILGFLLYKTNLVPKIIAKIGIVGGPVLLAGFLAVVLGFTEQNGTIAGLSALLVALFEFTLGFWLVFKGFNPMAIKALENKK